jgi:hypothetical protein
MYEPDRLTESFACASTIWSRGTTSGKKALFATSNTTVNEPTANATA